MSTEDEDRPEILDLDTEKEILFQRPVDNVSGPLRHGVRPDLTVAEDARAVVAMAVTGVLHHLRSCQRGR